MRKLREAKIEDYSDLMWFFHPFSGEKLRWNLLIETGHFLCASKDIPTAKVIVSGRGFQN